MVTERYNKTSHRQPIALDRNILFFRHILDRQMNNFTYYVICRELFVFLNCGEDQVVQ